MSTPILGIYCRLCTTAVVSWHRRDFRWCPCGQCFVDGGRDYLRWGAVDMSAVLPVEYSPETGVLRPAARD